MSVTTKKGKKKVKKEAGAAKETSEPTRDGKLIETDHPEDVKLIAAATHLHELRSEYAGLGKKIKDACEATKAIMRDRGLTFYDHGDFEIELKPGAEKVIVRRSTNHDEPQEEDDE